MSSYFITKSSSSSRLLPAKSQDTFESIPIVTDEEDDDDDDEDEAFGGDGDAHDTVEYEKPKGWGQRHTFALMGFFGFLLAYAMRFNLSIAIVEMVIIEEDPSADNNQTSEDSEEDVVCKYPEDDASPSSPLQNGEGEFHWSEREKGLVLGSFFWGYVITQLPGGWLATKRGGKWPMGIGLAVSGIMTLLTPAAARLNAGMLVYCRIIEGLAQGVIFPSSQQLFAAWAPPNELSFLTAASYSGATIGAAITMVISGYMLSSSLGWPSIFYLTGGVTLLWFIGWIFLVYDDPTKHPRISEKEKLYILSTTRSNSQRPDKIPWKAILTSGPVWAVVIVELCHSWGFYALLIELPSYLKQVLSFDMQSDGWISAAPAISEWICACIFALAADYIITKKKMRKVWTRKLFHGMSEFGAGAAIIGVALVGCDRSTAVTFLTLGAAISGGFAAGCTPNQVELSANYAGIIMGIANTAGNIPGFAVSAVAAALTSGHENDLTRWQYFFYISAGMYAISFLVYILFANTDEQPWNTPPPVSSKSMIEKMVDDLEDDNDSEIDTLQNLK